MFTDGKINKAVQLNGSTEFLQLPTDIANHQNLTVSTWVKWDGGADWQRVFDFGSGEDQYMFLTYSSNIQSLRFAMKNGAEEQADKAKTTPNKPVKTLNSLCKDICANPNKMINLSLPSWQSKIQFLY